MEIRKARITSPLLGFALLFCLSSPVFSQQTPGPPPIDRNNNPDRVRQQDMSRREYQLRNFGNQPDKPPDRRQLEALMAQTEQDFNRILTLHNEIVRALPKTIDYRFVSAASEEIRKRASRLQSTLALGLNEAEIAALKKLDSFDGPEMQDALIKLCKQIKSFVTNPVIETPNTVNAEQLTNARRDLELLIQLSGQIKKDADRLQKAQ